MPLYFFIKSVVFVEKAVTKTVREWKRARPSVSKEVDLLFSRIMQVTIISDHFRIFTTHVDGSKS